MKASPATSCTCSTERNWRELSEVACAARDQEAAVMAVPAAASPKNAEMRERVLRITIDVIEFSLQPLKTKVYDRGVAEPYRFPSRTLNVLLRKYAGLCTVI